MKSYMPARTTAQSDETQAARPQAATSVLVDRRASTDSNLALQAKMASGHPDAIAQRASLDEEEPLQGKFATAQRAAEEEEPLQGKFDTVQRAAEEEEPLQGKFETAPVVSRKENKTGLPDNLKSGMESLSGQSLDDVKVHYNSSQPAELQAHAYAQGTDIHVAPGQEQHLPHEAWHVVQQAQGRVKPTTQMAGVEVNDDTGLEHEADVMGAKALSQSS
jgi:hypothetical protein